MKPIALSLCLTALLLVAVFALTSTTEVTAYPIPGTGTSSQLRHPLSDTLLLNILDFSAPAYTTVETATQVPITVTLDTTSAFTITTRVEIVDGSATAGQDYLAANTHITFTPGITEQIVWVTILPDDICENAETVLLLLGPAIEGTYTLGIYKSATLIIKNDDICTINMPVLMRDWPPDLPPITDSLKNPGFELGYDHTTIYGEDPTILNPVDWVTWWEENPDLNMQRPEVRPIPNEYPYSGSEERPARIRSGYWAMQIFRGWSVYRAGFLQTVGDLPVGATAVFSTYAHAWACNEDPPPAYSCNGPSAFHFKVGIDPNGGADPFADTLIWTDKYFIYDIYDVVGPITATVGSEGAVTVFIYAEPTWPLKFVDAYLDDAALTVYPK